MLMVATDGFLSVPLDSHVPHGRRREVTDAELHRLRKALRQVEQAEGLNLRSDDPDPRPRLQKLETMFGRFKQEQSTTTIKNLSKEWGATSPPALDVARSLRTNPNSDRRRASCRHAYSPQRVSQTKTPDHASPNRHASAADLDPVSRISIRCLSKGRVRSVPRPQIESGPPGSRAERFDLCSAGSIVSRRAGR